MDLFGVYTDLVTKKRDVRVDGWPLMDSPWPTLVLVASYVYLVKSLGPRLVKDRQPLPLGPVVLLHSGAQVVFSLVLLYKFFVHGWLFRYSLTCQPVDYSEDADATAMIQVSWWYLLVKLTAFADTLLLLLQEQTENITDLHVAERVLTPLLAWCGVRTVAGGHATFFATADTFVRYQNYTSWKKYLTTLQTLQHLVVFVHSAQLLVGEPTCPGVPSAIAYVLCAYSLFMLVLIYLQNETDVRAGKSSSPMLGLFGSVGTKIRDFMVTLTSACAMDQSVLYESTGQELGHADAKKDS